LAGVEPQHDFFIRTIAGGSDFTTCSTILVPMPQMPLAILSPKDQGLHMLEFED
jgi:hypothetical protein